MKWFLEFKNLCPTLFRNKGFLVNLKTERNASNFAMFMEKENPHSFLFVFHLEQLSFLPYEWKFLELKNEKYNI